MPDACLLRPCGSRILRYGQGPPVGSPRCSVGPYVGPEHPHGQMQCVGPSPTVPYVGSYGA
eukprot:scaffold6727_cov106-Isochrysis_galbana.AAC.5